MIIQNRTINGAFKKRLNRFEGIVVIDDKEELVHIPNTGRCRELLVEGATVILEIREKPNRKTPYELIMVYKSDMLISIDSQAPNKIVEEAVRSGAIKEFKGYPYVKREAVYGNSRFDLMLKRNEHSSEADSCFIEVKGVTLESGGVAKFPDAPTERGAKHVNELVKARKNGYRAAVVFLIQMEAVTFFRPNWVMDEDFSKALSNAHKDGVEVYAYNCIVAKSEVVLKAGIPVDLIDRRSN